jgi:cell wall-associated NlpC family hydrolase
MSLEAEQRARVVAVATEWLRTPYEHNSRVKGKACDCTFVAAVYQEAGLIPHVEIEPYTPQWHLNQREEKYLGYVERFAHEIAGPPQPGDIVLYRFGRVLSHSGIVVFPGWPLIIHAGMRERKVCYGEGDQGQFAMRQVARRFFSFW